MSNSFEFNARADEWLDITSKEEILQNELNQAKNELETRSMELLESNVTIDLLKGHKTLLENERESLQTELKQTKEVLSTTGQDLENTTWLKENLAKELESLKASSASKEQSLEQTIGSCKQELGNAKSQIGNLEQQISTLKKEQSKERSENSKTIEQLNKLVEKLSGNIRSLEADSKKQAEQLALTQKELQQSSSREENLRRELAKQTSLTEQRTKELQATQANMGSVSVLAETLKEKNSGLLRSMTSLQKHLDETKQQHTASSRREAAVQAEFAQFKTMAVEQRLQLEQTIADGLDKLEHAEDRIVGLEAYAQDLKEQFVALSEERETLLETIAEKERMCRELSENNEQLKEEMQEQSEAIAEDLEKAKEALLREEKLKAEMEKQKIIFEARLHEIRTILGVTVISEFRTEIETVARLVQEKQRSCPSIQAPTLRVPLLIGIHNKSK